MLSRHLRGSKRTLARAGIAACVIALTSSGIPTLVHAGEPDHDRDRKRTETPIKHLIVFIGENRTFDHIYATYQPKHGQSVANLLSKGIIDSEGMRGLNYMRSQQFQINQPYPSTYFIDALVTAGKTGYLQSPGMPPFRAERQTK
jgi:phospholipase C